MSFISDIFAPPQPEQLPAQPWNSTQTQAPPTWLLPFLEQGMGLGANILNDRLAGMGAPPTFDDVLSGRYSSNFTGERPNYSPIGAGGARGPGGREPLGPDERPARPTRRPGLATSGFTGAGGGGVGGGRGGGAGGGGGGLAGLRNQIAQQMVDRAGTPSPALGAGTDFLMSMLGRGPGPMAQAAAGQQAQAFQNATSGPMSQLLASRQATGNASVPYRTNFIDQLFERFNTPVATPGPVAPRYDLLSQFSAGQPLFQIGGF